MKRTFAFSESIRPGAHEVLDRLRRRGISLAILSGDHPQKVGRMAEALGIPAEAALGGLSPVEKAERVRGMDRQDSLYLGDGANDSLAFDVAWVTGTPVVDRSLLESKADFFTLGSGLEFLGGLFEVAKAHSVGVRTAFSFALVYNMVAVALSCSGHMSPLLAAVLMPLSSVISIALVAQCFSRWKKPNKG